MIICFLFFFFCKFPLEMNAFYIRTAKKKEKKIGQRMETIVPIIEKDQLRSEEKFELFLANMKDFLNISLKSPQRCATTPIAMFNVGKRSPIHPSQRVQRKEKTFPDCSENITNRLFLIIDNFICD